MEKSISPITVLIAVIAGLFISLSARADTTTHKPAAIIEDIKAAGVDFELLDFLFEGTTIKLAEDETLTLAYLRSCIVEEFKGGVITIGQSQSEFTGGNLRYRESVDCDGGGIVPTESQAQDVAGIVFRAPGLEGDQRLTMVYATAPVFAFSTPVKEVVIERMDADVGETQRFAVDGKRLDMAEKQVQLAAGGLYRATTENGSMLFRVSRKATAASTPVISRLVGF